MSNDFSIARKILAATETVERTWNAVKDGGKNAFHRVEDAGKSAWYNVRCLAEGAWDVDNVLDPKSSCQADVPHLLHFAGDRKPPKGQSVEAGGTFEMSCPKPHFLNTGPHRTMIWVTSYKGESYVMAIEESKGIHKQNVFIGSFSPLWQEHLPNLPKEYIDGIVSAAVYAMTGIELGLQYHDFDVRVMDPNKLLREGCRPSKWMQDW